MKIEWKNCLSLAASIFLLHLGIQYWPNAAQIFGTLLGAATPLIVGGMIAYIIISRRPKVYGLPKAAARCVWYLRLQL